MTRGRWRDEANAASAHLRDTLDYLLVPGGLYSALPPWMLPRWLPIPGRKRYEENVRAVDAVVFRTIERSRQQDGDRSSLLAMLLDAVDAETGERMTNSQLRDEAMTLFFAGYETTASTLAWAVDYLVQQPECADRVRAELDAVLGGREPTDDEHAVAVRGAVEVALLRRAEVVTGDHDPVRVRVVVDAHVLRFVECRTHGVVAFRSVRRIPVRDRRTGCDAHAFAFTNQLRAVHSQPCGLLFSVDRTAPTFDKNTAAFDPLRRLVVLRRHIDNPDETDRNDCENDLIFHNAHKIPPSRWQLNVILDFGLRRVRVLRPLFFSCVSCVSWFSCCSVYPVYSVVRI